MFSLKKSVMSFDVYLYIFQIITKPATAIRFLYMPSTRNVTVPLYISNLPFGIIKYNTKAIFRFSKWSTCSTVRLYYMYSDWFFCDGIRNDCQSK